MESQKKMDKPKSNTRSAVKTPAQTKNGSRQVTTSAPSTKSFKKPAGQQSSPNVKGQITISIEPSEIALRAYFISERRRNEGLPGDEHQDWIQAHEQLLAEKRKKKSKSVK